MASEPQDIIARLYHEYMHDKASGHVYGCNHTPGRRPECDSFAMDLVEMLLAEKFLTLLPRE